MSETVPIEQIKAGDEVRDGDSWQRAQKVVKGLRTDRIALYDGDTPIIKGTRGDTITRRDPDDGGGHE
jgi:hypothetical protein